MVLGFPLTERVLFFFLSLSLSFSPSCFFKLLQTIAKNALTLVFILFIYLFIYFLQQIFLAFDARNKFYPVSDRFLSFNSRTLINLLVFFLLLFFLFFFNILPYLAYFCYLSFRFFFLIISPLFFVIFLFLSSSLFYSFSLLYPSFL